MPEPVLKPFKDEPQGTSGYIHWCEGCQGHHYINTKGKNRNGAQWAFNDDMIQPTFQPSIHIYRTLLVTPEKKETQCHYFIRNGNIQYLNDCNHKLKGKTVPLEPVDL